MVELARSLKDHRFSPTIQLIFTVVARAVRGKSPEKTATPGSGQCPGIDSSGPQGAWSYSHPATPRATIRARYGKASYAGNRPGSGHQRNHHAARAVDAGETGVGYETTATPVI